jgi:hypothetical protein
MKTALLEFMAGDLKGTSKVSLSPEEKEHLKSLGYLR